MFRLIGSQPLSSLFLGFDRLFNDIDRLLDVASSQSMTGGFPPYNLFKDTEDGYSIELAVAGYKKSDLSITRDRRAGTLTIKGESGKEETPLLAAPPAPASESTAVVVADGRTALKQGIAKRSFVRTFTLAEDLEVTSADVEDGLLTIRLKQVKREDDYKPETILIGQS